MRSNSILSIFQQSCFGESSKKKKNVTAVHVARIGQKRTVDKFLSVNLKERDSVKRLLGGLTFYSRPRSPDGFCFNETSPIISHGRYCAETS